MKIKYWALVGVLYVAFVIGGYTAITGANPLESTDMHDDHGNGEEAHESHDASSAQTEEAEDMDHQHHQTDEASDVHTDVSYNDGEVRVQLEDVDGTVPKLEETHEEEMHLIIVSNDLEDYFHLHPEHEEDGIYTVPVELEEGQYQAFVDISPEDKAYQVAPNSVQVGTNETGKANLNTDDSWTKEIDGKTVTLEDVEAKADEEVPLVFDMHGENPEPHMGALGHVVIVDEDGEEYIHVHPDSDDTTSFHAHFPKPGMYKIWAEFKFGGEVNTYPFIIEVNE